MIRIIRVVVFQSDFAGCAQTRAPFDPGINLDTCVAPIHTMASRGYDEDEEEDVNFDTLESTLLGEAFYGNSKAAAVHGMDLDKKINLSVRVQNDLVRSEKKGEKRINIKGREDRATSEQVLDPRTRLILLKLLNLGFLTQIDGCLSTGKEANVYYAKGENDKEYAVKIFKTSILVFKDRDKYVSGEYRFRHGYCRSNPRKMVKVWAEKEMRNLKRLQQAGLFAPVPHLLKSHVLIMVNCVTSPLKCLWLTLKVYNLRLLRVGFYWRERLVCAEIERRTA